MSERVELPAVTPTETDQHVSLLLIADGLRQAEVNLSEQENNINKLSQQLQTAQNYRIATLAQKNLLLDLQNKILELDNSTKVN
jgi:hypothetical protein